MRLVRCDSDALRNKPEPSIQVNVNVVTSGYCLRHREKSAEQSGNHRPKRNVSKNISYTSLFSESESDDNDITVSKGAAYMATKSESWGYWQATHNYMIACKRGLISGPSVRTHAIKILKQEIETDGEDSDQTIIAETEDKPKSRKPKNRKTTGQNKTHQKNKTLSMFKTRTYALMLSN